MGEGKKLNNSPWREAGRRKMNGGDSGKDDTHPVFFLKKCHGLLETLEINLSIGVRSFWGKVAPY